MHPDLLCCNDFLIAAMQAAGVDEVFAQTARGSLIVGAALRGPIPFAVVPHRAKALYSWLMRPSDSYRFKPWPLLHELKVGTFASRHARRQHPLHAFLPAPDLRDQRLLATPVAERGANDLPAPCGSVGSRCRGSRRGEG